ncbi:MAG: glycoside hydrolase family 43 protein [bacterium]
MNARALASTLIAASLAAACYSAGPRTSSALLGGTGEIVSGEPWLDIAGQRIEAHGGGIVQVGQRYFWYGENHTLGFGNKTGISVYWSDDLVRWQSAGIALPKDSLPLRFRDTGVAERPKVIYNTRTKQYVMWIHLDANRYFEASAGVATSATPWGPFHVVRIFRPIQFDYGYGADSTQLRERELGNTYRDMALFRDDDGAAYVYYASESNKTLYAVRLNDDYTDIVRPAVQGETWARLFPNQRREAPAPFKAGDKYYMITSAQTGWAPNPARYHVADRPLGPWTTLGNPVSGEDSLTTFRSQSAFVLAVPAACERCFVYMGDRWEQRALERSTYIWVPFVVAPDGTMRIDYRPRWRLGELRRLGATR